MLKFTCGSDEFARTYADFLVLDAFTYRSVPNCAFFFPFFCDGWLSSLSYWTSILFIASESLTFFIFMITLILDWPPVPNDN